VVAYSGQRAPDGLWHFLARGACFAEAHYGHAHTVTTAGHAEMLTGAYPHLTGIIGISWRKATGEWEYCTGDIGQFIRQLLGNNTAFAQVSFTNWVAVAFHPKKLSFV
jgi:predicted AlkP superfamily pyrophosphatase or phosphodiesterase